VEEAPEQEYEEYVQQRGLLALVVNELEVKGAGRSGGALPPMDGSSHLLAVVPHDADRPFFVDRQHVVDLPCAVDHPHVEFPTSCDGMALEVGLTVYGDACYPYELFLHPKQASSSKVVHLPTLASSLDRQMQVCHRYDLQQLLERPWQMVVEELRLQFHLDWRYQGDVVGMMVDVDNRILGMAFYYFPILGALLHEDCCLVQMVEEVQGQSRSFDLELVVE
jgi:hypothetical protein